jgi:hypothetical protein
VHERKAVAGTLQHWLDPGKGITGLAGAFASYYALKEQLITY